MLPVCLITGFLGSGKTTFLKRIAARHRGRRIVFLVNEFSPLDIDGHLLGADTEELVVLPGGSIFCKCLITSFIATLKDIQARFGGLSEEIDGVVIEASGIANPKVVEQMLHETKLDLVYRLACLVCIVDPGTFLKLLRTLPNTVAQVEASDVVIVNKTDLFDDDILRGAEDEIRRIRPDACIVRAVHCDVAVDLFNERAERGLQGEYAACADPHFARYVIHLTRDVDLAILRRTIEDALDIVYRLKGFVTSNGTTFYVDANPTAITIEASTAAPSPTPGLALVAPGDASEEARQLVERLKDAQIG